MSASPDGEDDELAKIKRLGRDCGLRPEQVDLLGFVVLLLSGLDRETVLRVMRELSDASSTLGRVTNPCDLCEALGELAAKAFPRRVERAIQGNTRAVLESRYRQVPRHDVPREERDRVAALIAATDQRLALLDEHEKTED